MRKGEALRILREELELADTSTDYDFTVRDEPREEAKDLDWWRTTDIGAGETKRNKSYFRAYIRIANGDNTIKAGDALPVRGLRLTPKGRLYMDRYFGGKMCERGFLEFQDRPAGMHEPAFVVTEAGEEWSSK
jgi:hypothetical protein